jgi:hypothetical protein
MYGLPYQPIHWLSRTSFFKPKEKKSQRQCFPERKTNLSPLMKTLKNSDDLSGTTKCSCVLRTCRIRGYAGLLHASILCVSRSALLDCSTSGRAKDDQRLRAFRYEGKYVEVCGLVVSVTSSPLGTTFINFGREYQTRQGEAGD